MNRYRKRYLLSERLTAMDLQYMRNLCVPIVFALSLAASAPLGHAQDSPAGEFKTLPGFEVDLVYNVSKNDQGSWVSLCLDDKGRIIASDQYGKLYRVTLKDDSVPDVETLDVEMGMAHGLLYAFGSLYTNVNGAARSRDGSQQELKSGVYRLTDTNGDDQFDKIEHLVELQGRGEHGPHGLILSPDGKQIYLACGNTTDLPSEVPHSRVPRTWDEDHILGRMPDARGHNRDRLAPGGWIARMDPDGGNFELMASGFRNEYDIAFNADNELFTYDADMEWDIGSPWYRPTRVNHVISGAEFGWRNGTGKWPDYYGDSFGAVVNIGPGSPTGITFGYGTSFPTKYKNALYICDWSYGAIHAVHLQPDGASYSGQFETFLTAAPMAVTDIIANPNDGAMYFAVGGRRTASALYRVRYSGDRMIQPAIADVLGAKEARDLRHQLESFHGRQDAAAINLALDNLGNSDRAVRFAARIALEHQPLDKWRAAALAVRQPQAIITAAYALARSGAKQDEAKILERLSAIHFDELPLATQLELLRAYELVWLRLGEPNPAQKQAVLAQIDQKFPGDEPLLNRELAAVLAYLNAPNIVARCVEQMSLASAQEDQIHYAFCLRNVTQGWDDKSRLAYFRWFFDVASARGGASFGGFLENIRSAALEQLDNDTKAMLGSLTGPMPPPKDPLADLTPRAVVQQWTVDSLQTSLSDVNVPLDYDQGRMLTATAQCFRCHRFNGQGGIQGPDLTAASQRFNAKDMLTAIIEPDKEISDQYQATQFLTEDSVVVGRVANLNGDNLMVVTNMLAPGDFTDIKVSEIVQQRPSPVSMMPAGLLDTFQPAEIAQILAYLRSGGLPDHEVYR